MALFVALVVRRPEPVPEPIEEEVWVLEGQAMGTTYAVKVVPGGSSGDTKGAEAVAEAADAAIQRVNTRLSTYSKLSELSQFNTLQSKEAISISTDFSVVVAWGLDLYEKSGGAFDVTIGPLINLWGFGPDKDKTPPTGAEVKAALDRIGSQYLELSKDGLQLSKSRVDLYVDLSAIAKGYGVDEMGRAIESLGYTRYLVEVGGEVLTKGNGVGGRAWRIGLETPDGGAQDIESTVALEGALATSGNYRNFKMVEGKRVAHTMDPRTGAQVDHSLASVSIISDTCMEADGWATALLVMGEKEGLKVAEAEGIAARLLVGDPEGNFSVVESTQWKRRSAVKKDSPNAASVVAPESTKGE
jgi:thiamine biosynthesis lipoprotein